MVIEELERKIFITTDEHSGYFETWADNKRVAVVNWRLHPDKKIEIFGVETHQDYRGIGLMTKLFRYSIDYLKQHVKANSMFLHSCGTNKTAVRLYARNGFKVWKVQKFDNGTCYNMRLKLKGGKTNV